MTEHRGWGGSIFEYTREELPEALDKHPQLTKHVKNGSLSLRKATNDAGESKYFAEMHSTSRELFRSRNENLDTLMLEVEAAFEQHKEQLGIDE